MQRVNARWSCAARRFPRCGARARLGTAARRHRAGSTASSPKGAKALTRDLHRQVILTIKVENFSRLANHEPIDECA
jgi:hypothetical protein